MKDFKRGGHKGGFKDRDRGGRSDGFRNKRSHFGDRGFKEDREMFKAVCSNCGNSCEVPFRPTGDKPVLCNDCFGNSRNSDRPTFSQQTRRSERQDRNESKPDHRLEELTHAVSELSSSMRDMMDKLDQIQATITTK